MIKYLLLTLSLLFFILTSCSSGSGDYLSTYTVTKKNFENILAIDGYVESLQSTTLACPMRVDGIIQSIVDDGVFVNEGDIVCVIEAKELETFYDEQLVFLENARAQLNTTKATMSLEYSLLEAQVKNNEADTQIAQLDSLQLTYSPEKQRKIKELELERVFIEKNKHEKKLKSLAIIQQSEIRKLELEIQRTEQNVKSLKEIIDELVLRAPKKGLVTRAKNRSTNTPMQVGDNVWNNMPIIIMPEMENVKVKIMAPEQDYKYINIGDSVQYTFDAMPENIAWGKILKRSPVGQPINQNSKVKLFEIEASIDSTSNTPDPGFTANCKIWLKSVRDTIVAPQIAIFDEDSIKVVYVKKGNKFEKRQVLTGISSPKEAIISKGLEKDEIISLVKPTPSSIKDIILLPDSVVNINRKEGQVPEK